MNSVTREQRFARVAERELRSGGRSGPIWEQALDDTFDDTAQAESRYMQLRVEQMLNDEAAFEKDQEALAKLRRFNDGFSLSVAKRNALLGAGVLIPLIAAVLYLIRA